MKKTLKKIRKGFLETMLVSTIGAAIIAVVLGMYAFIAHGDCFFTTSPNFKPLSEVAPMLDKMILANIAIAGISFVLLYCVAKLTRRHH